MGVPAVVWKRVAMNPREAERKQVAQLLVPVGHAPADRASAGAGFPASASCPRSSASRCCCTGATAACRSAAPPSRRCERPRCCSTTWSPGPNGGPSPVWDAIGYAGPARQESGGAPPKALRPLDVDGDTDARVRRRASSARARAAAPRPGCWRRPASTWSCSRPAATTTTRTSTAASCEGYGRMYMYGGGAGDARPERRPARRQLPRRRHHRQLHDLVPHARRRARGVGVARRAGVRARGVRRAASTPSASAWASTRSTTHRPRASRCSSAA